MKKSILILTDLSDNAQHVAEAALLLAGPLQNNLILLNCDELITTVAYYPIVPVMFDTQTWHEDRERSLNLLSEYLQHKFHNLYPHTEGLIIKSIIKEGDLLTSVKDVLKKHPINFIVMGAKSGSSTEHFLFGSETKTIADHVPVPIVFIPENMTGRPIRHITFATNFLTQDIDAIASLLVLRRNLGAILEIVHIRQYGQSDQLKNEKVWKAIDESCKDNPSLVLYHEVYGKEVTSRLQHFASEHDTDLMVLSHEHHSYLYRTFREGIVQKSLYDQKIPLLVIPKLNPESHFFGFTSTKPSLMASKLT